MFCFKAIWATALPIFYITLSDYGAVGHMFNTKDVVHLDYEGTIFILLFTLSQLIALTLCQLTEGLLV